MIDSSLKKSQTPDSFGRQENRPKYDIYLLKDSYNRSKGIDNTVKGFRSELSMNAPHVAKFSKFAKTLQNLIKRRSSAVSPHINYELLGTAFNQAYFFKNFVKNLYAFSFLQQHRQIRNNIVVDIGCGAGVASLAWNLTFTNHNPYYILIDKSQSQISIANQIWSIFPKPRLSFANYDYRDYQIKKGIHLASYWLTSQKIENIINEYSLRGIFGDFLIIVDYSDVIDNFVHHLSEYARFQTLFSSIELPETCRNLLRENYLDLGVAVGQLR